MDLKKYGPWAVVAGASEGTGRAFCEQLAAAGINCALLARRAEPLELLATELQAAHGVECLTLPVDLSADNAVDEIVAALGDREVGLFISYAGADTVNAPFLDASLDDWLDLVQRNVMTVMCLSHLFAGPMRERGRGGLLLVGSGACYAGAGYMAAYAGSKAFTLCFAEGLWAELRSDGVDVLHLVLGQTDTPAFRASLAQRNAPVPEGLARPEDVARVGLKRLPHGPLHNWGQADDQAGMSPESAAQRRQRVDFIDTMVRSLFNAS